MARFCPNCGAEVSEQNVFCTVCGTPMEAQPLPQEPSHSPQQPVMPVLNERPVYSVNTLRPAESHYTAPHEQYSAPTPYPAPAESMPPVRKKHTGRLAFLVAFLAALIASLAFFAISWGWFTDKHSLDGDYTLSGFVSGGEDFSASIASVSGSYTLTVRGNECTMTLGEGSDTYHYTIDQSAHTLSNGTGVTSFTVSDSAAGKSITIQSDDSVMTFTKR